MLSLIFNSKFSQWHILKFEIVFITGFIRSNKDVKQVVLMNQKWSPPQRGWGLGFCLFSKNIGKGKFFPQKRSGYGERVTYDWCLYFCL